MAVTEDGTTRRNVILHKRNYVVHRLIFNTINKLYFCASTEHSEHPPYNNS
jgi:hypothetical protein